jgi:hypothetical protein
MLDRKQDAENKGGTHGNDARVKTYTLFNKKYDFK